MIDALLGAAGMGDIGQHFPDTDERWRDADSIELLRAVRDMLRDAGYEPANIDATLACEAPKLSPFRDEMRSRLAGAVGLEATAVNVKSRPASEWASWAAARGWPRWPSPRWRAQLKRLSSPPVEAQPLVRTSTRLTHLW